MVNWRRCQWREERCCRRGGTFRAAAFDQLQIWSDPLGVDMIKHKEARAPAAVVFDTISAGKARDVGT
jgi:fused signal recognition particle receptor